MAGVTGTREQSSLGAVVRGLMRRPAALALMAAMALSSCGEAVYDSIRLMPPPAVYIAGEVDPFPKVNAATYAEQSVMFYATDRRPATADDAATWYANERGFFLRGGSVTVRADPPFSGWDEVRAVSLSQQSSKRRDLRLDSVTEFGILPVTTSKYVPGPPDEAARDAAGRAFAGAINKKLSASVQRDIFLYVHGYNVDFDYPVLSAKELQHYMGYRGAFVTYAWPATPNRFAYFKDLETADATRRNLRELIMFLSRNTRAENIHIIGYSAGSRLAFETVYDLTLQYPAGRAGGPRLGQLILIGSDLDRTYFIQALDDGLLQRTRGLTIYMSSTDAALRMSGFVLGEERLGQVYVSETTPRTAEVRDRLSRAANLSLIDVSDAEGSSFGNGHSYFRSSPWASSDLFVSLIYGLDPGQRGLVRAQKSAVWSFPEDYPKRVVQAVKNSGQ